MKRLIYCIGLTTTLIACSGGSHAFACRQHATTDSAIAIANLDDQIARLAGSEASVELLLVRSRFLGDYDALGQAINLAERHRVTGQDLLRAAQVYSAEHRFGQALDDLAAAERTGVDPMRVDALRASIRIATGEASAASATLEAQASKHPGYASHSALAIAYAEQGRYMRADALFERALADLDTTLPFPYAWLYFARGMMWAEQAGDLRRGERFYAQALTCLPEFAAANIHMAEIEVARGNLATAAKRLERVLSVSREPEAMALLGVVQGRMGDSVRGNQSIEKAKERYAALLRRHPLAFADHAAEFYLGPGGNAERAWQLASQNLANRETRRAFSLAIDAALSANHPEKANELLKHAQTRFGKSFIAAK